MEQYGIKHMYAQRSIGVPLPTIWCILLSKPYQIVLAVAVDTPVQGDDIVDGFNDVQKWYLAIFLRMSSTPEVDKIGSKRMRVHAMTEK